MPMFFYVTRFFLFVAKKTILSVICQCRSLKVYSFNTSAYIQHWTIALIPYYHQEHYIPRHFDGPQLLPHNFKDAILLLSHLVALRGSNMRLGELEDLLGKEVYKRRTFMGGQLMELIKSQFVVESSLLSDKQSMILLNDYDFFLHFFRTCF